MLSLIVMMGSILLIDFMYLWNRLFYAYRESNNPSGYYEHIKGMLKALNNNPRFLKKYIVLDGRNCSQRHKRLLSTYKEGREPKQEIYKRIDELIAELSPVCPNLSFQTAHDYEADEVIASWVKFFRDYSVYIYSGDKDLIQLTRYGNVFIGDSYSNKEPLAVIPFSVAEMEKKTLGVSNGKFKDYKNILKFRVFRGDSSDNIPPVIPRLRSDVIINLIESWDLSAPLNTKTIGDMFNKLPAGKYNLKEVEESIKRNYLLMNLIHIPYKTILRNVKELRSSSGN